MVYPLVFADKIGYNTAVDASFVILIVLAALDTNEVFEVLDRLAEPPEFLESIEKCTYLINIINHFIN